MKAYLKFDLDDPLDKEEFLGNIKALEYWLALWDFKERLNHLVIGFPEDAPCLSVVEDIRDQYLRVLDDRGITLEEYS